MSLESLFSSAKAAFLSPLPRSFFALTLAALRSISSSSLLALCSASARPYCFRSLDSRACSGRNACLSAGDFIADGRPMMTPH
ncbi:hypothetical protein D3C77_532620 [compost metagenome]